MCEKFIQNPLYESSQKGHKKFLKISPTKKNCHKSFCKREIKIESENQGIIRLQSQFIKMMMTFLYK